METVKPSAVTTPKSKLARTFAKVLHFRTAVTGIVPDYDEVQKSKSGEKLEHEWSAEKTAKCLSQTFDQLDEELERKMALEALAARIFASTSAIKASYAQLQYAQSPYDVETIQAADQLIVSELKKLSELKQCFLKKQYDPTPEQSMVLAEIQEQKSVTKTFEIMGKKLESQLKVKESEISLLRKKAEESNKQNKAMERSLGQSGQLSTLDNLHITGLSPTHFIQVLRHTVKSIRSFVRLMIDEMKSAEWNIEAAAKSVENNVVYWKADDKCYAFESFVCREMFDDFHKPFFSLPMEKKQQQRSFFFEQFMELKSLKVKEYLSKCPRSVFAEFCRAKYLKLVHPKMEASFFSNLSVRNMVNSHEFPDTIFFALFAEMAKRVWLLHCFAFAFDPEASIFQVTKGCRFSEVYMESVADESVRTSDVQAAAAADTEFVVAFTVVPGFRIGKTVIQCQVYLSQLRSMVNR